MATFNDQTQRKERKRKNGTIIKSKCDLKALAFTRELTFDNF